MEYNDVLEGRVEVVEMAIPAEIINGMEGGSAAISFHQILGQSSSTTMELRGILHNRSILILADSGSNHNFILDQLVEESKLPTHKVPDFGVTIGNGDQATEEENCNIVVRIPY
ncbi:hypothetical protein V2J09_006274 [Rumex salicifolius]